MTISARIKRIADKDNIPYRVINNIINGHYGKETINFEQRLKLLEKEYGIQ